MKGIKKKIKGLGTVIKTTELYTLKALIVYELYFHKATIKSIYIYTYI